MTCLKAFDFHANLFNQFQAVPAMKLLYLWLHNMFGAETVYHSWAADVKQMCDGYLSNTSPKPLTGYLSIFKVNQDACMSLPYIKKPKKADLESLITLMPLC